MSEGVSGKGTERNLDVTLTVILRAAFHGHFDLKIRAKIDPLSFPVITTDFTCLRQVYELYMMEL